MENLKVRVQGSSLSLTAPLWVLAAVLIGIGVQAEQRISRLEDAAHWTELVLRTKYPATTGAVDRVLRERRMGGRLDDDDSDEALQ